MHAVNIEDIFDYDAKSKPIKMACLLFNKRKCIRKKGGGLENKEFAYLTFVLATQWL